MSSRTCFSSFNGQIAVENVGTPSRPETTVLLGNANAYLSEGSTPSGTLTLTQTVRNNSLNKLSSRIKLIPDYAHMQL